MFLFPFFHFAVVPISQSKDKKPKQESPRRTLLERLTEAIVSCHLCLTELATEEKDVLIFPSKRSVPNHQSLHLTFSSFLFFSLFFFSLCLTEYGKGKSRITTSFLQGRGRQKKDCAAQSRAGRAARPVPLTQSYQREGSAG